MPATGEERRARRLRRRARAEFAAQAEAEHWKALAVFWKGLAKVVAKPPLNPAWPNLTRVMRENGE